MRMSLLFFPFRCNTPFLYETSRVVSYDYTSDKLKPSWITFLNPDSNQTKITSLPWARALVTVSSVPPVRVFATHAIIISDLLTMSEFLH